MGEVFAEKEMINSEREVVAAVRAIKREKRGDEMSMRVRREWPMRSRVIAIFWRHEDLFDDCHGTV